ncbi:MAG TPA: hypothetical protein DD727_05820, partial [Clostridiales bacterium]|nr:hypothetical protein [Clostridiales bacterium]
GTGLLENHTVIEGNEGLLFYAEFRPELYELIVEHAWNKICDGGRKPDSRIVWEILKLKEICDGPGGMALVRKGTAAAASEKIRLDYSFYVGKYEVTFTEYDRYCDATGAVKPDDNSWGRGDRPVINVKWSDAVGYANWLSRKEGLEEAYVADKDAIGGFRLKNIPEKLNGYRLLTSMEWDYAAYGGPGNRASLHSGSDDLKQVSWYKDNSGGRTQSVGQLSPNLLDIYDMSGNVSEWVNDTDDYESCYYHGNSWYHSLRNNHISFRSVKPPQTKQNTIGFRIARSKMKDPWEE